MKKLILVVVVLIAVAALGLPPLLGGMTQTTFETHIADMDNNPVMAMQVAEYERGWFGSQARVEIALDEQYIAMITGAADDAAGDDFDDSLGEQHISVGVDISHGPIVFSDGLYFGLSTLHARLDDSDPLIAIVTEELGIPYLAELDGQVSYTGTFSFQSNIPPVDYIDENGQIAFSGLNVDGTLRGDQLLVEAVSENLSVDVAGNAATFENLQMSADSTRLNDFLWVGDFDSSIESVTVVDTLTGTGSVSLAGIRMDGSTDLQESGELMDARVTYAVAEFSVPEEEIELTDSEVTISFDNVSVAALTDYYEMMLAAEMQNPAMVAMALPSLLTEQLAHNPAIAIDPLRFTLNGDSLNAAINVRVVNGDQGDFDFSNPMMLLSMLEATANLTAAKTLVERLATQATMAQFGGIDESQLPPDQDAESMARAQTELVIATFLGQGYIVDDGENYTTEIEYANGEVRVNGTPLPLGALLQ